MTGQNGTLHKSKQGSVTIKNGGKTMVQKMDDTKGAIIKNTRFSDQKIEVKSNHINDLRKSG